jgi:hypothetical protein
VSNGAAIEAVVTEQGLVVPPTELDKIGVHPGDRVIVSTRPTVRPRRMAGIAASATGAAFTNEHLREIRREMGQGIGEDIER